MQINTLSITVVYRALIFAFVASTTLAQEEEPPLPYDSEEGKSFHYTNKLKAAESALRIGLSGVSISLYEQLLTQTKETDPEYQKLLLGLASAQISQGQFTKAQTSLSQLSKQSSPHAQLMYSLLAYHSNGPAAIADKLKGLSVEQLPPDKRGWFHLMSGLVALSSKNQESAEIHFNKAFTTAVSDAQETEFRVLRYRTVLTTSDPDEVLAVRLKQEWQKFKDKSVGFDFALEYASVLQALNRSEEAIRVINTQLQAPNQNPQQEAHLQFVVGLLDKDPAFKQGRLALEEVVSNANDLALAKAGLSILANRFDALKGNDFYVDFLDRLLSRTKPDPPHPLRENLLLLRGRVALRLGAETEVEKYCSSLMQEYPASPWRLDALRTLATIAWRTNPPEYRRAANWLQTISSTEKELGLDFSKTGLLMADCHFLAKDFDNASAAYKILLGKDISPEIRSRALFQYVNSLVNKGELQQAIEVLDEKEIQPQELQSWWRAEWNLVAAIRKLDGPAKAYDRIRGTLESSTKKIPETAIIRLTWLQAQLSLDLDAVATTPELADKILSMMATSPAMEKGSDQYEALRAQTLLTKGHALLRLQRPKDSFATFGILREEHKNRAENGKNVVSTSEIVALSYLLEANYHSSEDHLAEAQRTLVTLVDLFPKSSYAPRALYEASINAERRGLSENLEEARDLLEVLATRFKGSDLLFYARLRQGHLLRKLDDFGAALDIYNEILRPENDMFNQHPDLPLAKLSQADCMLAMAKNNPEKLQASAERFGDLFRKTNLPLDFRIEAGCKRAACLRKASNIPKAQAAYYEVIHFFESIDVSTQHIGEKGRYWASRTIFELAETLEGEGAETDRSKLLSKIHTLDLPGKALAKENNPNESLKD